ncbi:MAG TPA: M20 family metallo-hydrolase [Flavisolibacter sp.]|jgi:acetylornithine deacetylase
MNNQQLFKDALGLLQDLVRTPSFSREEDQTAGIIARFLAMKGAITTRIGNNVIAQSSHFDLSRPTILLNSHHDTVKPNAQYTRDPFSPDIVDGKLYGLGSNDAGGCLVALAAAFVHFMGSTGLKYNVLLAATAEEEISGPQGIESILSFLPQISFALVGEPTKMQMAVAERGLMVLDATAKGRAGHAARNEGENAIYKAMKDIQWFSQYRFPKVSELLGPVQMSVTVIQTENKAHNVVPGECSFVVDVRVNELYSFDEILQEISAHVQSEVKPRSTRLRSTMIPLDHPVVKAGTALGLSHYGSPTSSDKALMPFPALKIGPGDSARSHTADEFIYVDELEQGIERYIQILNQLV